MIRKNKQEIANRIKFYVYGEGKYRESLQNLIEKEKLEETVFLKGKIPNNQVPEILNNLDIFCITSNKESFGVAIVEAMACEVPVVATDAEGFCEVMEANSTGYIVERRNIKQIADALEKLIENRELRIKFGKNGRERVISNYDWKQNVKNMEDIYNFMLQQKEEV